MSEEIKWAAEILRRGGLVAFPTETVYGLGADATNAEAVRRVFTVKGRPSHNPIIVHVSDAEMGARYVMDFPANAIKLAEAFWPGPLTLVLPRANSIPDEVTAGGKFVGIRAPRHPIAQELLREFGKPIAAPSANKSNRISPTTAGHVRDQLAFEVDLILDGGPCDVGIESTVLNLSQTPPIILRPGGLSREKIEEVIGYVRTKLETSNEIGPVSSPGQQPIHYAPQSPAYRFELPLAWARPGGIILHVCPRYELEPFGGCCTLIAQPPAPDDYARQFYAALHEADSRNPTAIWIELPPDEPEWAAIRDRIIRATKPVL
jgi:L-threonylcarbamoyladenylate synthase